MPGLNKNVTVKIFRSGRKKVCCGGEVMRGVVAIEEVQEVGKHNGVIKITLAASMVNYELVLDDAGVA